MTLNRALFTIGLLILTTFAVLAFGNPQWGKWAFMFQDMIGTSKNPGEHFDLGFVYKPRRPENYTGVWKEWDSDGTLLSSHIFQNGHELEYTLYRKLGGLHSKQEIRDGRAYWRYYLDNEMPIKIAVMELDKEGNPIKSEKMEYIYDQELAIDRRAEFGIAVE